MGAARGSSTAACSSAPFKGWSFSRRPAHWDAKEQAAVRRWFAEYLQWLTESDNAEDEKRAGNNHASWWAAQTAAVATFVENQAVEKMVFNFYREQIFPKQIRSDGSAPREESRTTIALVFGLQPGSDGHDLPHRASAGRGPLAGSRRRSNATIVTVIDYLQPYLTDPHKWRKEQVADFSNEGLYFLAFAGMGLKRPEFVSLFRKLERPKAHGSAWST